MAATLSAASVTLPAIPIRAALGKTSELAGAGDSASSGLIEGSANAALMASSRRSRSALMCSAIASRVRATAMSHAPAKMKQALSIRRAVSHAGIGSNHIGRVILHPQPGVATGPRNLTGSRYPIITRADERRHAPTGRPHGQE